VEDVERKTLGLCGLQHHVFGLVPAFATNVLAADP
jgi:hypothetical protein